MPGKCVALDKLPPDHATFAFLKKKPAFTVSQLQKQYNVCYCYEGSEDYPMMTDRIVLPIYYNSLLVGWQGRTVVDATPKYYTMPGLMKGKILFNYDTAKTKPIVVVCEGIFDAMAVGECGVAILGSKLTAHQKRLLYYTWKAGALIMLLDSDDEKAQEEARSIVAEARTNEAYAKGAANVVLPGKRDADEFDPRELWTEIYNQSAQQGVRLT